MWCGADGKLSLRTTEMSLVSMLPPGQGHHESEGVLEGRGGPQWDSSRPRTEHGIYTPPFGTRSSKTFENNLVGKGQGSFKDSRISVLAHKSMNNATGRPKLGVRHSRA